MSWEAIRPRLYKAHSDISKLISKAEATSDMTDDEIALEAVNSLIAEKRTTDEPENIDDEVPTMRLIHENRDIGIPQAQKAAVQLSDSKINFDDETATLHIGKTTVRFPSHKNEHLILRHMFGCRIDEAIDWELVYETISGHTQNKINKKDIEKRKRSVRDGVSAINKRIAEVANTETKLITMKDSSVIRHF